MASKEHFPSRWNSPPPMQQIPPVGQHMFLPRVCPNCEETFVPEHKYQHTCSDECLNEYCGHFDGDFEAIEKRIIDNQ